MRRARLVWLGALALLVALAAVTWAALEGPEVVVLRTRAPDGSVRETRVWIAEEGGSLWLEAATPERGWYRDLLTHPELALERGGRARVFEAHPVPGPTGHARIRRLLREKYGPADVWVALLQDTSRSVAVRLEPRGQQPAPRGGEGTSR